MDYKKKSIIISIFFILIIQILLLINNRQKTSFRYFIWNIEEVSIGRLVFISFISGLLMSSLLDKTVNKNIGAYSKNDNFTKKTPEDDNSVNNEERDASNQKPPERDLRDTQPTISVNYRVIKDSSENEITDSNQTSQKPEYKDDWYSKDLEW